MTNWVKSFTDLLLCVHVGIHQMRILVSDKYQMCPVLLSITYSVHIMQWNLPVAKGAFKIANLFFLFILIHIPFLVHWLWIWIVTNHAKPMLFMFTLPSEKKPIVDLTLRSRAGPSLRFPHSHYLRTTQYITRLTINVKTTHSSCVWLTHISDIHFYHSKLW